jgi:hypothetical protein
MPANAIDSSERLLFFMQVQGQKEQWNRQGAIGARKNQQIFFHGFRVQPAKGHT